MSTSLVDVLSAHLKENALHYFPDLQQVDMTVNLLSVDQRPNSDLYHYEVVDNLTRHAIIAKTRTGTQQYIQKGKQRPYRFQFTEGDALQLEADALSSLDAHFNDLNHPKLHAIGFLDFLPQHKTIIMMESTNQTLRSRFLHQNRIERLFKPEDLTGAVFNAGAWLRHFHSLPPDASTIVCYETVEQYFESVRATISFLKKHLKDDKYFEALLTKLQNYAQSNLPDSLPLGRLHGDFAPRNILVDEEGGITGIDTLAHWHTSIYEDIATFLNWLWNNQFQIASFEWMFSPKVLQETQNAFLKGYFNNEPIPQAAITFFRVSIMLDYWADKTESLHNKQAKSNVKYPIYRTQQIIWNRHHKRSIDGALAK